MHFHITTIAALAAITNALPALQVRQSGPVLASTDYNSVSISGGQAGNAAAEALAVFSALDVNNPGNIDPADVDFLGSVNKAANAAEVGAFNPAIAAATGADADALSAGKIKNKVLKLTASTIQLKAKMAQGQDVAAKLAEETTKLNTNIATDTKSAGNPSTALQFDATITGGGSTAAGSGATAAGAATGSAAGNGTVADASGSSSASTGKSSSASKGKASSSKASSSKANKGASADN